MRVFVAINLPAAERERLHASLAPLRLLPVPVRWLVPDALHLTLKFIGEIDGSEVSALESALRGIAAKHEPLALGIGGFGAFPSLRRANVVWVGIRADAALQALQQDVEFALSRLGYPREQHPFRPHITVARARTGRPPDVARLGAGHDYDGSIRVETIDLMRTHAAPDGARYETLLRAGLGSPEIA
jgi:RNA 2',3'-cyclic 3'-phosphodiesterase